MRKPLNQKAVFLKTMRLKILLVLFIGSGSSISNDGSFEKQPSNLEDEFSNSLEIFRKRMGNARTDAVSAPPPPIQGQVQVTRERSSGGNSGADNEDASLPRSREVPKPTSEQSGSECDPKDESQQKCQTPSPLEEREQTIAEPKPVNDEIDSGEIEQEEFEPPQYDADTDDLVAAQIREAAESVNDPDLKKKLWEEYESYKESL